MPLGLELLLGGVLVAFVLLALLVLQRSAAGPLSFWVAGWVAAGIGGLLTLASGDLPRAQLLAYPFGTLFPWLLLAGAVQLSGARPPAWLLPLAVASGLLRAALAAGGHEPAAYGLALAVEPGVAAVAGWIAHRAAATRTAGLAGRLLGPSFVLLAAAGVFHLTWLLLERPPTPVLTALWMMVTPPALGLQVWTATEGQRRALREARDDLERRVTERTHALAAANEALRRSEDRYRAVSELSSDFSFAFRMHPTLGMRLDWVTGAFQRITGATPDALEGRGWLALLPLDVQRELHAALLAAAPGRQVLREIPICAADGCERRLEVRAHTAPGDALGELRVVGAARDVTDTRRAEAERHALERRMHESERLESLGRLSGGIAHDFNNLLSVILGNVSLAAGELPEGAPARARLARIRTAAQHAARLTDQMLTYAGKAPTDRRVIDLSEVVSQMLELVRAALPERCELDMDLAPALSIEADETQIQQIVLNLVTNAGEALDDAGGRVRLRTAAIRAGAEDLEGARGTEDAKPGEYAVLEVRDWGRGMDAEAREHLFDPFFSTKFTGRGMGLASVLGIVRAHRGVATLESRPGHGTRVRVLIPRIEAEATRRAVEAQRAPCAAGRHRILVVDDDVGVLEVASEFLRRGGFDVVSARDGRAGIERLRAEKDRIDAVVLDLSMPGVSGEQAFLEMRSIRPDLPVVLATGYSEELASERFRAPGAAGFLRKPFSPEELIACVRGALG
jgi:PAS domain S-box-containing protein